MKIEICPSYIPRQRDTCVTEGQETINFWSNYVETNKYLYDYQGYNLRFCDAPSPLVVLLCSFVRQGSHDYHMTKKQQFSRHALVQTRDSSVIPIPIQV